jgi:hypothetical protein
MSAKVSIMTPELKDIKALYSASVHTTSLLSKAAALPASAAAYVKQ